MSSGLTVPSEGSLENQEAGQKDSSENSNPRAYTFVLPGRGRSGGVRVTVEMAEHLLKRGHSVRIVYRQPGLCSARGLKIRLLQFSRQWQFKDTDWLPGFSGEVIRYENFSDLEAIGFVENELVIAVGTMTVDDVYRLPSSVHRIRYCHGFSEHKSEAMWKLDMPTISVSPMLIDRLKEFRCDIAGIVPNGINADEYFVEERERNAIGCLYNENLKKAPVETLRLIGKLAKKYPEVPLFVISDRPKPTEIPDSVHYVRYPSVDDAREIYNKCKLWLVTSKSEGFCLPILEAMACGAAVVSSDHDTVGGLVTDKVNGRIVETGSDEAFLSVIDELLSSEDLRRSLVSEGGKTVVKFSWDAAVDAMELLAQERFSGLVETAAAK